MASLRADSVSPPRDSDSDSESGPGAAGSTLACALGCRQPWALALYTGSTLAVDSCARRVLSGSDGDDDSDSELDEDTEIEIEAAGDEGPRKHVCAPCAKAFHRPSSLRTHMHTHTGALPFVCPFPRCEQGFNVKSNLRRHYRTHKGMKNAELPAVLPTTSSGRRAVRGRRPGRKGAGAAAEEGELGACPSAQATTSLDIPATTLGRASTAAVDAQIRNPGPAFSHPQARASRSPSPSPSVASIPAPAPPRFPPLPQFDHDFSGFAGMARMGKNGAEGYGIATGLGFRTAAMLMTNLKPGPTLVEGQFPRPVG